MLGLGVCLLVLAIAIGLSGCSGGSCLECSQTCTTCSDVENAAAEVEIVLSGVTNRTGCTTCAGLNNTYLLPFTTILGIPPNYGCNYFFRTSFKSDCPFGTLTLWDLNTSIVYNSTTGLTTINVEVKSPSTFGTYGALFQKVVSGRIDCNSYAGVSIPYVSTTTGGISDCILSGATVTLSILP